jgi:hypothetical protein
MKSTLKLVREGDLVAEVSVLPLDDAGSWSPVLSVDDANKLDEVRMALRTGDLRLAAHLAQHVYRLIPLALGDADGRVQQ